MTDQTNQNSKLGEQPERFPGFLRAGDQRVVGAVGVCLLVIVGLVTAWLAVGGDGLANVETLPKNRSTFQVDLNQADWPEISALPKIGEKMARRIVAFREENGPYSSVQSLTLVEGIGSFTLNSIRPYIAELPLSDKMVADKN